MSRKITITNGGKEVPTNEFVEEVTTNVILAILQSLRDVDVSKETVIRIDED